MILGGHRKFKKKKKWNEQKFIDTIFSRCWEIRLHVKKWKQIKTNTGKKQIWKKKWMHAMSPFLFNASLKITTMIPVLLWARSCGGGSSAAWGPRRPAPAHGQGLRPWPRQGLWAQRDIRPAQSSLQVTSSRWPTFELNIWSLKPKSHNWGWSSYEMIICSLCSLKPPRKEWKVIYIWAEELTLRSTHSSLKAVNCIMVTHVWN